MRLTRTLTAVALVGVFALAGCASPGSSAPTTASTVSAEPRTISTDYGDVTVPGNPQRIVVLNYALAGYLFDLDVPVVATIPEVASATEGEYSEFWADDARAQGTEFLPWSVDGFDLEAILEADPDLIIGGGIGFPLAQAEKVYDDLSEIAPTVLVGRGLTTWQQQFSFIAEAFGKEDVYADALAAYDAKVADVKQSITPPPGPASMVAFTADGSPYVLVESVGLPTELTAVGIELAPLFASGQYTVYGGGNDMFQLSTEQVGQVLTQPSLFVLGFNGDYMDADRFTANPVHASLPAAQSGNVYTLPYWALRADYDEAMATLDLLDEMFTGLG